MYRRARIVASSLLVVSSSSRPKLYSLAFSGRIGFANPCGKHFTSTSSSLASSSSKAYNEIPDESSCRNFPMDVMSTMQGKADWDDRIALQAKWTNPQKGWQAEVEWKKVPFGTGVFAAQDIDKNQILRIGKNGYNLLQFQSVQDIEEFCRQGQDEEEYTARLLYTKDYLWGYSPSNTDEKGYDISPPRHEDRFFGMWIPGNGLNHSPEPNTVYRTRQRGTQEGIVLVALRDIQAGEELYDDYRRHGQAPPWLLEFAKDKQVSLNFAECNDFVNVVVEKGDDDNATKK